MQEFVWTDGMELALIDIKNKSLSNSESHKNNYYFYKSYLKYFRVPTIILSGLNSVFNVGLQPYISQSIISVLCCSISLLCGIIASVELFLGIQNIMEKELISSKEFYVLYYDVFKMLSIEREHRMISGKIYLDDIHSKYCNLIESASLLHRYENSEIVKKITHFVNNENKEIKFENDNNNENFKNLSQYLMKNPKHIQEKNQTNSDFDYDVLHHEKINVVIKTNEDDHDEEKGQTIEKISTDV